MKYYIGIDLGTSSLKGILTDLNGNILKESSISYDVIYPKTGWTEQNPKDWETALNVVLTNLSKGYEKDIYGLSIGGQMHGLVILDDKDNVIRPCILWNDGRTEKQTNYLNNVIGKDKLSSLTGNIAFAGFTAPKILWVKENEPENFDKIAKIMLPKDYLTYLLTGTFSTDYSDASGMLLLDVKNKKWSKEMCDICSITEEMLPSLYESYDVVGKVISKYNLPNCIVTAGAGDNAAAAIGTGTVNHGDCNISLGTSGTIFICQDSFSVDDKNALHSFAHAQSKWHLMGCILTAASARKWWLEDIIGTKNYDEDELNAEKVNTEGIYFLPYLAGERSPHNDVNARGAFIGLSSNTTRAQMSKAVMEGVAFALRDCLEIAKSNGVNPQKTTICGGGAKGIVWKQIVSDILGIPVSTLQTEQGPSFGAALLAMMGNKEFNSFNEIKENIIKITDTVYPNKDNISYYEEKYKVFKKLYPLLKEATK